VILLLVQSALFLAVVALLVGALLVDRSGVHGVAIFAAGLDNFWRVIALSETVPDDARVGPDFYEPDFAQHP